MRNRNLLHMNKLDRFKLFAAALGYVSVPTKGEHEVLRLKPPTGGGSYNLP